MTDAEFSLASRNQRRNKVELKEGFQADKWDVRNGGHVGFGVACREHGVAILLEPRRSEALAWMAMSSSP